MKLKLKITKKILAATRKCSISVIIALRQNTMSHQKIKYETGYVPIEEFVGLNSKMCSFLVEHGEQKNEEGVKRNVVATIRDNDYQNVLLNNKWIE